MDAVFVHMFESPRWVQIIVSMAIHRLKCGPFSQKKTKKTTCHNCHSPHMENQESFELGQSPLVKQV